MRPPAPSRRTLLAAGAAALLIAALAIVLLTRGGDDGDPADRYAATWQRACQQLRADARRTTAAVERAGGGSAARGPVGAWLRRTAATLATLQRADPPDRWRPYHRRAAVSLADARRQVEALRAPVARGRLGALARLDLDRVAATPEAPADLRRRTPACVAGR
ncbi:hypothetical protein [Patulibacter defluvii]|uniref:hypothetical protein n=1 Tax=Patulibacter defluvii TaxID=3095358 RepID=UPI002A75FF8F|nr:hypothetical protein [Patulibacter sp. DM4]